MDIISRKEAKAQGLKHYFTGKPCKRGGIAQRLVSDFSCKCRACVDVVVAKNKRARNANPELVREKKRAYYAANPGYRTSNSNGCSVRNSLRYQNDPEFRARRNAQAAALYHKKFGVDAVFTEAVRLNNGRQKARRRSPEVMVPLTAEEKIREAAIYKLAAVLTEETGIPYEVDHHIPLKHGGKHHPDNLWVIPRAENRRKHAKLPPELAA